MGETTISLPFGFGRRNPPGTSGDPPGASRSKGWRGLAAGWLAVAAITGAATVVNALSIQADRPAWPGWRPWAWEGSSTAVLTLLAWLPWLTIALAPPHRLPGRSGWGRFLALHAGGVLLFSASHVLGMAALRHGLHPGPVGGRFLYELRKDVLTYAVFAAVFWLARSRPEAAQPHSTSFDIRDGARLIRTALSEILAVASAGNYVEFVLADGRRPLMRATLAAVETELAPRGFVRTHRSWLINTACVTGLRPEDSGDWTVELGGASAPLSRRYRESLARLKRGESGA